MSWGWPEDSSFKVCLLQCCVYMPAERFSLHRFCVHRVISPILIICVICKRLDGVLVVDVLMLSGSDFSVGFVQRQSGLRITSQDQEVCYRRDTCQTDVTPILLNLEVSLYWADIRIRVKPDELCQVRTE